MIRNKLFINNNNVWFNVTARNFEIHLSRNYSKLKATGQNFQRIQNMNFKF